MAFEERDMALIILGDLWSNITHTSPPHFNDFSESEALRGVAFLYELIGEPTDEERRKIAAVEAMETVMHDARSRKQQQRS